MKIVLTYKVRLVGCSSAFGQTVAIYRRAVGFFIDLMLDFPGSFSSCTSVKDAVNAAESLSVLTKKRPEVVRPFCCDFYKFPSYLRRSAIAEAFGLYSSYMSNVRNWEEKGRKGRCPGRPEAGHTFPAMYRDNTFVRTGIYEAELKVWIRNTWDWVKVKLRKSDVDYIRRRCTTRRECTPTLCRRGKVWSLDFPFEESVELVDTPLDERVIVSVDLGINNACACSVMTSGGAVLGRRFLSLPKEYDSLSHAVGRIRKAQGLCARRMPRLWGRAKGINRDIASKTAGFIIDVAIEYNADVIVMEALDLGGKKRGAKKQTLHLWKARDVQRMVEGKAHRLGMRISRVCAWGTSRLAYDGSGPVKRGTESERTGGNYSLCEFQNGKIYNCDLSASYNIGARYFIREIEKSVVATRWSLAVAKVPGLKKRSTCTLSDLISLNAVI